MTDKEIWEHMRRSERIAYFSSHIVFAVVMLISIGWVLAPIFHVEF